MKVHSGLFTRRRAGVSLMSTLLLVTVVMLVAATMAGVFTMNMNITQRISNGTVALNEAEAGVAEVLYQITREENLGDENAQKAPVVTWGLNDETVRATITPGMSEEEAFHVVTFDTSSSFPHSTNNTNLDRNTGSMGRAVPDGKIHIVSTGYCKGQYRTVECLVERPPFPFGLATSGPILSNDPIKVKGTSSLDSLKAGEEDRPGHIVCNSAQGVKIGAAPPGSDLKTEVSGFVKSAGPVDIAQPAIVRGGVRTFADKSTFADIKLEDFDISGEAGVVKVLDSRFDAPQELDVMYEYSGGHLQYMSRVNLNQAMVYVNGDLTVHGPLTGQGLIVVTGNANFKSGTSLSGSNKMAILAGGDISIEGNNNYFTGLVYTEGNLKASNVIIVGNTIVNASDPDKGKAELDNVTVVSNEETGDMTLEVKKYLEPGETYARNDGNKVLPSFFLGADGTFGAMADANGEGYILADDTDEKFMHIAENQLMQTMMGPAFERGAIPDFNRPAYVGGAGEVWDLFQGAHQLAVDAQAEMLDIDSQIEALNSEKSGLGNSDDDEARKAEIESEIATLEQHEVAYTAQAKQLFVDMLTEAMKKAQAEAARNTDAKGTMGSSISGEPTIVEHRFNLNEYLPESEKIKMSFWKVYPRRM